MLKKTFALVVLLCLTVFTVVIPKTNASPSLIPDEELKKAINAELVEAEDYEPTKADLESLTTLDASSTSGDVTDLTGLEHATDLVELNLGWNQITDLSPLSGLTSLTELLLFSNNISDISPLSNLTGLEVLSLNGNDITDVSDLGNLTNLTELSIGSNENLVNILPLKDITSLRSLSIQQAKNVDFSQLEHFTQLEDLSLHGSGITDVTPLTNLTNLKTLSITQGSVEDLTPIKDLPNLVDLWAEYNSISDLSNVTSLIDQLNRFYANNQEVTLPAVNVETKSTSLSIANPIKNADGSIVDGVTINNGTYDSPEVTWTGLTGAETEVSYSFDNGGEFSGTVIQPINWVHSTPTISADDIFVLVGNSFDPMIGVTATDQEDGDITNDVQVIQNDVDTSSAGDYQVKYEVTDNGGKTGDLTRNVKVVAANVTISLDVETELYPGQTLSIASTNTVLQLPTDLPIGTKLTISDVTDSDKVTNAEQIEALDKVLDFHFTYPSNTSFAEDFTLTMKFDSSDYSADQVDIYYYNENAAEWEKQNGSVDGDTGTITTNPSHFSIYGAFVEENSDDSSDITDNNGTADGDGQSSEDDNGSPDEGDNSNEGQRLPDTATPWVYQLMLVGAALFLIGLFTLRLQKIKNNR